MAKSTADVINFFKEKTQSWSLEKKIIAVAGSLIVIAGICNVMVKGVKTFATAKYVELSAAEIKQLDCDELIQKNVGKTRQFCGDVAIGFVRVFKQDLYNSTTKYCCNAMKQPDDTYCYIAFGQYDYSRFNGYPEGIYSFTSEISTDCNYEYRNQDIKFANHCLKRPRNIRPADDKTKAKLGMY